MQSKINNAEANKRELVLDGEGQSEKILQEARGLVESLKKIADALEIGGT